MQDGRFAELLNRIQNAGRLEKHQHRVVMLE
jgi:hypothetical protein